VLQGRVDDMLPIALFDVLQTGFVCLGAFVLVAVAVPFILPVFAALLIAFYYFRCLSDRVRLPRVVCGASNDSVTIAG
jgi:hypothetical protein